MNYGIYSTGVVVTNTLFSFSLSLSLALCDVCSWLPLTPPTCLGLNSEKGRRRERGRKEGRKDREKDRERKNNHHLIP